MVDRSVDVVYSEDVRFEKTNQTSLIGVYSHALAVPAFPFVIPKLCLWIRLRTSRNDLFHSVRISVLDEIDQSLAEIVLDEAALKGQEAAVASLDWAGLEDQQLELGINYVILPVPLNGPTLIRPRVITERETLKCNALRVQLGVPLPT